MVADDVSPIVGPEISTDSFAVEKRLRKTKERSERKRRREEDDNDDTIRERGRGGESGREGGRDRKGRFSSIHP